MKANLWNIHLFNDNKINENIVDLIKNTPNQLYLLNFKKEQFNLIEKYVYDIAVFHLKRLNIDLNDEIFIEFWFKSKIIDSFDKIYGINNFHVDCDEEEKSKHNKIIHPILSCVTYGSDSLQPTIITDVNYDDYKFKNFENKEMIQVIFPEKNKHITFDGSYMHGAGNIFDIDHIKLTDINYEKERIMLAINLWKHRPLNIKYFVPDTNDILYNFDKSEFIIEINANTDFYEITNKEIFTYDFYENLFYNKENISWPDELITSFKELITKNTHNFLIKNNDNNNKHKILKNESDKYNKVLIDISDMETITLNQCENENETEKQLDQKFLYNRFVQRHICNKIYGKTVCDWIIFESEEYAKNNGGWTTSRHENYATTDIPVEKIVPVFRFVLHSFQTIFQKIQTSYCLPKDTEFNIKDLFVVKYSENAQNSLDLHHDGSFITVNILLNDASEFEGGGTYFNDGTTVFLEQGDMLIHSGKIKHAGIQITKGKRYLLVAFIGIKINVMCKL
jgi:hypothetical protein